MNKFIKVSMPIAIAFSLIACGGGSDDNSVNMTLSAKNLEALGPDFDYEGWIIVDGSPVSTGKFDIVDGATEPASFDLDLTQANAASTFILTIEPSLNDPAEPAATHILAGNIPALADGKRVANIVTDHPAALNSDFTSSAGTFILATPTNGNATPTQGIWYLNPPVAPAGPTASLTLPTLPEGWNYEGWVVGENGPISTGTFTDVAAADSDAGGSTAGLAADGSLNAGPPFPGQDFINPALDLIGLKSVISIEPSPDNAVTPFSMKPLAADITDTNRTLNNISASNLPSATVRITF